MKQLRFDGKIEDGKIILLDIDLYRKTKAMLEGKEITMTIGPRFRKRSNDANAYYWAGIIGTLVEEEPFIGTDPNDLHYALLDHLTGEDNMLTGLRMIKGSSRMSTKEFSDYIDRIVVWAATEHGITIPTADQFAV